MGCAIVTGGSRGIGKAIAIALAKKGNNIVINYFGNEEKANAVVEEIKGLGVDAIAVKGDVGDFDIAKEIVDTAGEKFETVDILVNNAGITRDGLVLRMSEKDFDDVINTNLKGAFNMCKHTAKVMSKNRCGKIVNITSVVGETGNIGQSNYASAKAGMIGLTKSLAKELASRNINVNAIAPGFIQTDMTDVLSDTIKEEMIKSIPLKKFGNVEDIANAVSFLTDEKSNYITGQVLNVCGGMVM